MKKQVVQLIALAAALLGFSGPIRAGYVFSNLGTLGGTFSYATAINNLGQVVGQSYTAGDAALHATIWNNGTPTDLGTLGGVSSIANGINDLGQVVGTSSIPSGQLHATLWNGATRIDLGTLGGNWGYAKDINNSGIIVGASTNQDDNRIHATKWDGSVIIDLGLSGGLGNGSLANAINNHGVSVGGMENQNPNQATVWSGTVPTVIGVAGYYSTGNDINSQGQVVGAFNAYGQQNGVVWNGAIMTILPSLGGGSYIANSINDFGQIVGISSGLPDGQGSYSNHATLWNETGAVDLNDLLDQESRDSGWLLVEAYGINNAGSIVGYAINFDTGAREAFLLSLEPTDTVPEPVSSALALAALGALAAATRRRRKHS